MFGVQIGELQKELLTERKAREALAEEVEKLRARVENAEQKTDIAYREAMRHQPRSARNGH